MKATALIKSVAVGLFAVCCSACDSSSELSFEGEGTGGTGGAPKVHNIADLKRLCSGTTFRITQDITLQGVVTGNDLFGEFSKMLIIQDESGGIPVLIDHTALAATYHFGMQVSVHCNGLALGKSGGKIQLGATPTGEYSVDRIPRAEIGRYIRTLTPTTPPQSLTLTFAEVTAEHIDRFVRFDNVRFITGGPWCDPDPETLRPELCEREIADNAGSLFTVRIPGQCTYATEPVPSGTGSIGGILDYFNGAFSLRITNHNFRFKASEARPTAYLSTAEYSSPSPTK